MLTKILVGKSTKTFHVQRLNGNVGKWPVALHLGTDSPSSKQNTIESEKEEKRERLLS